MRVFLLLLSVLATVSLGMTIDDEVRGVGDAASASDDNDDASVVDASSETDVDLSDLPERDLHHLVSRTLTRMKRDNRQKCQQDRYQQQQQQGYGGGGGYQQQQERPRRCRKRKDMGKMMRKKIYKKAKMIADMMRAYDNGQGYPSEPFDHDNGGYGYWI